ncbi:MAG: cob(I)yrinic acid a,c-diamide adenosyltransferase [Gammaproteobacteria bacterium]|jgi:cob(I)alamin adenosyltransferase
MGHRLSKIYTRTGDRGETGLGDGSRVSKDAIRIEAFGSVDELNSVLGIVLSRPVSGPMRETLTEVQHRLFDLGGELSIPGYTLLRAEHVKYLELRLDELNAKLSPLKEFILPGGCDAAAFCHLARTVCRRAERRVITLASGEKINPVALQYLNRLSDLLFVMARALNRAEHRPDVLWTRDPGP